MKDSQVGSYAVVGLLSLLGTKYFARCKLAKLNIALVLISSHSLSRLVALNSWA